MPIENFKRVLTIAIAIDRGDIRRAVNRATAADLIALRDEVAAGVAEIESRNAGAIKGWIVTRVQDVLDMLNEELARVQGGPQ